MTTGCVIFAYNGDIDYGSQAVLAAHLVKKYLNIPVSLITDAETLEATDVSVFDALVVYKEDTNNTRTLNGKTVAFKNTTRSSVYDLTPYDRTLVIDSDFLVFSNRLKHYLEADRDFMICESMNDLLGRPGANLMLNPASIPMLWATNIIFNKTLENKILFDLVTYIKENWQYYGALYKFDTRRFRNDYAFSVACHMLGGMGTSKYHSPLPSPVLFNTTDTVIKITNDSFTVLSQDDRFMKCQGQDIHLMNKQDILNNYTQLMELAQ